MDNQSQVASLIERGDKLYGKRSSLLVLWQEMADHFYPERADFTYMHYLGEEFAAGSTTSYPFYVRRELGNSFSGMLRPTNLDWFHVTTDDEKDHTVEDKRWLEWASHIQRKQMYRRETNFMRATKEGDHDFATFGQAVITTDIDWKKPKPALLYKGWHLRDCAWAERYDGSIGELHIKWKPTVSQLRSQYGSSSLHSSCQSEKRDQQEIQCRIVLIFSEDYQTDIRHPWTYNVIDTENRHEIFRGGRYVPGFSIPRWQTVSGSQYAFSPATVAGLPDARMLQAMSLTLLEAGEMAVRPPLISTQEAIRGDIAYFAGGITVADAEYDERLGDVLRPVTQDKSGLPFGMDFAQDIRGMLASAFYLNKLTLPQGGSKEMTAFETRERVQEYIREALPLFEPMEQDYNGSLCEQSFELLLRAGAFGSMANIPRGLQGRDIRFRFESPLHDAIEKQKGMQFTQTAQLLDQAMALDPMALVDIDVRTAFRDAVSGVGISSEWLRREDEANQMAAAMVQAQNNQKMLEQAAQGGEAMKAMGEGGRAVGVNPGEMKEVINAAA